MGIVRDITVEELKQAVNNIDTSTLAQDSTLQAVVTAINNISGGSDPVTNTTVNTLGKDTTLQSIAAAIAGLGTALGSDKANISGDNIADPSTFRQNIGVINIFEPGQTYTGNVDNLTTFGYYTVNIAGYGEASLFVLPRVGYTIRCFQIALVYVTSGNIQVIARAQTGASSFSAWRELTN